MRRFIFNSAVLTTLVGGWNAIQSTRRGPRDWRLVLMWISWALTLAIAIGTMIKEADASHELKE